MKYLDIFMLQKNIRDKYF